MTEWVDRPDGRIAYEVEGAGRLVVLSPGLADTRATYRFLQPMLASAGFRVAVADLRGHGESSVDWPSYTRTDTAGDLIAVVEDLDDQAVIVGQSFSGGSATIAAARRPDVVRGIVEIAPFTRPPSFSLRAMLRNDHDYRRGALRLARFAITGQVSAWSRYLEVAYPGARPSDWSRWLTDLEANLAQPGRVGAAKAMISSKPSDAAAELPNVQCRVLVIMGTMDSDFADPEAEARAIVDLLPEGSGTHTMIEGAGHYPHAQHPAQVADAITAFMRGLPDA